MRKGVILYGPPASGKDTIANALVEHDPKFVKYELLKAGPGNQSGYRMTTVEEIDNADQRGEVLWRSDRYESTYAIDNSGFGQTLENGISVVQVGQISAAAALMKLGGVWLAVFLWCPRDIASRRLESRGTVDIGARLAIWDRTEPIKADLVLRTDYLTKSDSVESIVEHFRNSG